MTSSNTVTTAALPMTPLQSGMLFHAISNPGLGVDIEQISFELHEAVDFARLEAGFNTVTNHYSILRSAFRWADVDQPHRVVADEAVVPCTVFDWEGLAVEDRDSRWADLLERDRFTDFTLDRIPLQRLCLVRVAPDHSLGLWTFHHALLDGRSFPLVLKEVFRRYDSGPDPDAGSEADSAVDFEAFVAHVNNLDHEATRPLWEASFEGVEIAQPLTMWADAGVEGRPHRGVAQTRLSQECTAALRSRAAEADVSLNNLVQAAWVTLLDRYGADFDSEGPRDIVIGTTRACRHVMPDLADTVGLLINTLPLQVRFDRSDSLADLARGLRQRQVELRDLEATPLHLVQQWAGTAARTQLFESLVVFDEASLDARMADHGEGREFVYEGQTNYPLTLLVYGDDEMLVRLEHRLSSLSEEAGRAMLAQLVEVLSGVADDLDVPVGDVGWTTPRDTALFSAWNDTDADYDLEQTLVDLLEAQVERSPDAVAVSFEESELTYAEFNSEVNRLAHHLRGRGVGPEQVVGIHALRSLEMLIGIHAIVKAGGAYLPLDPEYPDDRLGFMVRDAGASLVLAAGGTAEAAAGLGTEVIDLDGPKIWARESASNPSRLAGPHNVAYVIYTSGSTGKPKGVLNEHRGIVNRLLWMQETFGLGSDDVVLQKTPFTFDVSVWELFWPLQTGAQLVMATPGGHKDTRYLVSQIRRWGVTTMHFVPSMLQLFVEDPGLAECVSLRRIICSGEALPRDLQDRLYSRLDDKCARTLELHNLYGPTEAAIDVTWWACDTSSPLPYVPIGSAIANTRMYVLDPALEQVPPGAKGELFIGGVQVARGYLNRPELNRFRFVPDPWGEPGDRMYRTGDLGRFGSDGNIEYLGRTDHQVKVRGFRIELGEIEVALSSHPKVSQCCVVDLEIRAGDKQLVAYFIPADGQPVDPGGLRAHLSRTLADYMIPSAFVSIDRFPLSTAGKIDRKLLPRPQLGAGASGDVPEGGNERRVAALWCELLEIEAVDRAMPFFEAGGHSLLAIRLAARLSQEFGREVGVVDVLDHATVECQAKMLDAEAGQPQKESKSATTAAASRRKAAARRRPQRRR
ncbi:MAG: amino acid adenylation domain-containing protein [Actinomycetia bacterium]|nr:amino acid adenylation domain-containing protein [Actinomycetes bacterium]